MFSEKLGRYVPLAAWIVVILTVLLIPVKIIGYGYLPADDAVRHAAKAISGKPWNEILVMRSDFALDPHPGWHAVLGGLHALQGGNAESLVIASIVGLMLLVSLAVLPWLRRPEAWLAVLLVAIVFAPLFIKRLALGRPYLFTVAAFLTLLFIWSRVENRRPVLWEMLASLTLIAAAAWIHGSWYQLVLPAAGLFLAGRFLPSFWYGGCWLAGSFLGAALTGHPWQFLSQSLHHLFGVFGDYILARQLVMELLPSDGDFPVVIAVVAMLFWRARSPDWNPRTLLNPIFVMGVLGWLLGFKVLRFWWDWGLPAILVWLALGFQQQFEKYLPIDSAKRLVLTCALAFAVYFGATADHDSRWTWNLTNEYLTQENPELAGWLPEKDGVLYSADMRVFNETFFKNPTAPWRYVLGFESALMLPEDLAVLRKIQWNFGDLRAYEPWVKKMGPRDRLVLRASWLRASGQPNIPQLEWHYAVSDLWVGRLPRSN